jgi:hypothetical protein
LLVYRLIIICHVPGRVCGIHVGMHSTSKSATTIEPTQSATDGIPFLRRAKSTFVSAARPAPGSAFTRIEYLIKGSPLPQLGEAMHLAENGQIVLAGPAFQHVRPFITATNLANECGLFHDFLPVLKPLWVPIPSLQPPKPSATLGAAANYTIEHTAPQSKAPFEAAGYGPHANDAYSASNTRPKFESLQLRQLLREYWMPCLEDSLGVRNWVSF